MKFTWTSTGTAILVSLAVWGGTDGLDLLQNYDGGVPRTWDVTDGGISNQTGRVAGVRPIWIEGERWQGKPTRIFAWWGLPKGASAEAKVPAMVLVHGGGGTAFASWVKLWNDRGYAAIAMDTCGGAPRGERDGGRDHPRHPWSGPYGWHDARGYPDGPLTDQWPYQAVTAVIRCHTFLRSRPEVDAERTGLTGISWGGYLTSITMGVDHRFKFAAPVYGCGWYDLNMPAWRTVAGGGDRFLRWLENWDPKHFIGGTRCPVLRCNGNLDFYYTMEMTRRSTEALPKSTPSHLSIKHRMPHGHPPAGDPKEITAWADHYLKGAAKPLSVVETKLTDGRLTVRIDPGADSMVAAELLYVSNVRPQPPHQHFSHVRDWTILPVEGPARGATTLTVDVPAAARIFFVNVKTASGLVCTSSICEREDSAEPLRGRTGPTWRLTYEKPGATNVMTSACADSTAITVELVKDGDQWCGRIRNREPGVVVHSLEVVSEPFKVDPATDAFYIPWSTGGSRIKVWPKVGWTPRTDGKSELAAEFDKEYVPDGSFWVPKGGDLFEIDPRMRMPGVRGGMQFMTVANRKRGFYLGSHDPRFTCKDFTGVYNAKTQTFSLGVKFNLWLRSGDDFVVTPVVMSEYAGDWHKAARRYREWWNRCFRMAYVPDRVKDMTGVMIVLLKQQNDEIVWPYTEFESLGRCARSYGFDHVEFHAWGKGGHDRLYPEYEPDPLMGGREGLVAGVKTLRDMGIHATVYSNGQLQERETTDYWRTKGRGGAIVNRDGREHTETWHKFSNCPAHTFDVVCYHQQAWKDRMLEICRDAKGYGFEGFFYDQIGVSRPRQCFAANHGHRPGDWVYAGDRHDLFKSIADVIHSEDPEFVLAAEGFHDAIFDSCAWFEGWAEEGRAWSRFDGDYVQDFFPEFVLYTFPEVVTTDRSYTPSYDRRQLNGAVVLNLRVNFAIRYRIDRAFVEEGRVPTAKDTQYMLSPTDHEAMAKADWAGNRAYMKLVNEWRKANREILLRGTFKADEGFEVVAAGDYVANRWDAADGRTGILVWNGDMTRPQAVEVRHSGQLLYAEEPEAGRVAASSAIPANTLRLYVFKN